jgi:hypothetical protein
VPVKAVSTGEMEGGYHDLVFLMVKQTAAGGAVPPPAPSGEESLV